MPIQYKDFFPEVLKKSFFSTTQETVPATVARANAWLAQSGVRLLNIETVVLPNLNKAGDASEAGIRTSGEISSYWYQVIRVWYESEHTQP